MIENNDLEQKGNWFGYIETQLKEQAEGILKDCPYSVRIEINHFFGHDDFVTEVVVKEV